MNGLNPDNTPPENDQALTNEIMLDDDWQEGKHRAKRQIKPQADIIEEEYLAP